MTPCRSETKIPLSGDLKHPRQWRASLDFHSIELNFENNFLEFYSPSPEYPAACRSGVEIPPIGAAGMNRAEAHQSEGGLLLLYHFNVEMATAQFRFDTPTACGGELH